MPIDDVNNYNSTVKLWTRNYILRSAVYAALISHLITSLSATNTQMAMIQGVRHALMLTKRSIDWLRGGGNAELGKYTPRELIEELKARGYKGHLEYTKTIIL